MTNPFCKILLAAFTLLSCLEVWGRDVEFSWAPMPGATKYEIQVSSSHKFDKIIAQAVTEKPTFSNTMDVGRYFFRVRVLDLKGRPGKWSTPGALMVDPYAPELIAPAPSFETTFYEIYPEIEFTWKSALPNMSYDILISRTSGEKVLESTVSETKFKTNKIPDGEYAWKVRAKKEDVQSAYTESRRFTVKKIPFEPPELIKPEKNGIVPAYRGVNFEWKIDPHAHFSDIYYEKEKSYTAEKDEFKKSESNLEKQKFEDPYEEPGLYKWWVVEKEGKSTTGLASEVQSFEVRNDVITQGNYELEFSQSYVSDLYTISSARQTSGANQISQQATATGYFTGFLGGYYVFESLGLFLSERTTKLSVEGFNDLMSESDLQMRLRFGARGFNQEFILGYRIMDLLAIENSPSSLYTNVTALGPLAGSRVTATISNKFRVQGQLFYFKPFSNMEGLSGWVTDVYGGFLSLKWNFMYKIWLGYRFQMERINSSLSTPGQAPSVSSSWTQYRLEPAYLSLSFEH